MPILKGESLMTMSGLLSNRKKTMPEIPEYRSQSGLTSAKINAGASGAPLFSGGVKTSLPFFGHRSGVKILSLPPDNTLGVTVGQTMQELVVEQLKQKPDSTFIFPTGNTPLQGYKCLREGEKLDWSRAKVFHLDEYVPPKGGMPKQVESYADYMNRELLNHVNAESFLVKDYLRDPGGYDVEIARQAPEGVDMVVLGIGKNGHIAFNEPGSDATSKTRIVTLTDATVKQNFGEFGVNTVKEAKEKGFPTQAMTLGMETILKAKTIVLLAHGEASKGDILRKALDPDTPPHPSIPASYLKNHPNVYVVSDFNL